MLRLPKTILILTCILFITSCSTDKSEYTVEVYQTSQAGDNLKLIAADTEKPSASKTLSIKLEPDLQYQEYIGFGASFTESSAWNLATIPKKLRKEVLTRLFSPEDGAGFSLTRTHINSSDYSNGHYTYVDSGDTTLATFSVLEDKKGFTGEENDQVRGI